jgi:acyl-CoA dehydrogenase
MTTAMATTTETTTSRPRPLREGDDQFVALAARVGAVAAAHAARHDTENTFVAEAYEAMRESGYLALAVPEDLGGLGATMRQIAYAQEELARADGAAALAAAMHLYNCLVQVFRRRNGAPGAEAVLRRVANDGLVIATSGGSDWLWPSTIARPEDGGFRVSGRKAFCSQAPAAGVITTSAVVGSPGEGAEVLMFALPLSSDGVRIDPTWNTLGMRGTSSHDVVIDEAFVPSEAIVARRPWGKFNPALMAAVIHFAPLVAAVYHGIAGAARDEAVRLAAGRMRGETAGGALPSLQRQVGLMDTKLRTSWWSLMGAIDEIGNDYAADAATLATLTIAKRQVVLEAQEVVSLAMEATGGRAYFRSSPLERAFRDVRAASFHPLTPESSLFYAGRLALGGTGDTE